MVPQVFQPENTFFQGQHLKLLDTPTMNWKVLPSSLGACNWLSTLLFILPRYSFSSCPHSHFLFYCLDSRVTSSTPRHPLSLRHGSYPTHLHPDLIPRLQLHRVHFCSTVPPEVPLLQLPMREEESTIQRTPPHLINLQSIFLNSPVPATSS